MSKNAITMYKGITKKNPATPELLQSNPTAFDKELVQNVKAIAKAQATADKAGYAVAYHLNELNKKRPSGAYVKRMGFTNIGEYAERFHNIASSSALAYAQTAEQLLTKDEYGIHSPYAIINDAGKINADFTVSQLMELRNAPVDMVTDLLELGSYTLYDTTKALRFKTAIVKALTTKPKEGGKENPYYKEGITSEEVNDILFSAGNLLLQDKNLSGIKALEMLTAPETPAEETPAEDPAEATPAEETPADVNPAFDTSDGAVYAAIMNAIKPYIDYADENADTALMESVKTQLETIMNQIG